MKIPEHLLVFERPCPPEHGVHGWIMGEAWRCRSAGMSESATVSVIRATEPRLRPGRKFAQGEVEQACAKVFGRNRKPTSSPPKWPEFNESLHARVMESMEFASWEDFCDSSPDDPGEIDSAEFLRFVFRGRELVCLGRKVKGRSGRIGYPCETLPLEIHIENLIGFNQLVPNPMAAAIGLSHEGKRSPRCNGNRPGRRRWLVIEADRFEDDRSKQLVVIDGLLHAHPEIRLAAVVDSGNKSLHSWWTVDEIAEAKIRQFFGSGGRLGGCPGTWGLAQLVRLPGAVHNNGNDQRLGWVDLEVLYV